MTEMTEMAEMAELISSFFKYCIEKYPVFCTIFFKTSTWYRKFLFYYTVFRILMIIFFHFDAQAVLCGL